MQRLSQTAMVVILAGLCACASAPPPPPPAPPPFPMTRSAGAWAFDYDANERVAAAQLRSPQGALLVEISCQAPRGPIEVRDWTFGGLAPGPINLTLELGAAQTTVGASAPASSLGAGGVRFAIDPLDPTIAALAPGQRVAVIGPDNGHDWGDRGGDQMVAVANACAQRGS